ncbi:hypothetical protein JKP88DRAFT_351243 [Tribonema minus]|uniref:DRBM domain-containing protein n=1 Tax=Tribonema minus TaxID=303371 RepID=A0A836C8H5_9STRA|nr:hypothetical protein JKP88DRAFT_351243 [Tribonema minus]
MGCGAATATLACLMALQLCEAGIQGFSKWFKGVFHDSVMAVQPGQRDQFDHVCFDMNQILHVAVRRSANEEQAIARTFTEISQVLKTLEPRRSVVFAFDGSAPLAKLLTQRARREGGRRAERYQMSALNITPGTDFMRSAAEAMRYYAYTRLPGGTARLPGGTYNHTLGTDFMRSAAEAMRYHGYMRLAGVCVHDDITPGTDFMRRAAEAMRYYAYTRLPDGTQASKFGPGDKVWLDLGEPGAPQWTGPWAIQGRKGADDLVLTHHKGGARKVVSAALVRPYRGDPPPGPRGTREGVRGDPPPGHRGTRKGVTYYMGTADVLGEGELKILDWAHLAGRRPRSLAALRTAYYVSGADVPGEGELKILDWAHLAVAHGGEESVVIVGGDADLVLQGLALSKVKNLFVYASELKRSGRIVSLWQVTRQLEAMFPGESGGIRNDLIFLLVLNGNDYLPKVRGVSFGRCFRHYCAAKAAPGGQGSFIIDSERQRFNWPFLLRFLKFATMGAAMALQGPTPAQWVNAAVQKKVIRGGRKKLIRGGQWVNAAVQKKRIRGGRVTYDVFSEEPEHNGDSPRFGVSVAVAGTTLTVPAEHASQKDARRAAATLVLQELAPELYEDYLVARQRHDAQLLAAAQQRRAAQERRAAANQLSDATDLADDDDLDLDLNGDESSDEYEYEPEWDRAPGKGGHDVKAYLTGVLWNIHMYQDGFAPDNYWRYGHRYAPSCHDMADWVEQRIALEASGADEQGQPLTDVASPVSRKPALPSDVACLAMMSAEGRDLVPRRLRALLDADSPVGNMFAPPASSSSAQSSSQPAAGVVPQRREFDIDALLAAVNDHCPEALNGFAEGRQEVKWTVIQHASQPLPRGCTPLNLPPPIPPLDRFLKVSPDTVKCVTMPATSSPPGRSWAGSNWAGAADPAAGAIPLLSVKFKKPFRMAPPARALKPPLRPR